MDAFSDLDILELIYSDGGGRPNRWGGHNHWIRWTTNRNPHTVAQMRAGGANPGMDCAPAACLSRFLDDGHTPAIRSLEAEGGTNSTYGTSDVGVGKILTANFYHWQEVRGAVPAGRTGMNSAWGGTIAPSQRGSYAAATTGRLIIIQELGWWSKTAPLAPAPAITEDTMGASFVLPDNSQQARFWIKDGHIFEMWYVSASGKWNGPVDLTVGAFHGAGAAAGGLSASASPDGTQLLFWTGQDGHQWHAWYANGWNGPVILPNT